MTLLCWPNLSPLSEHHGHFYLYFPLPVSSFFHYLHFSVWYNKFTCQGIAMVYLPPNSTSKSLGILPSTWWHSSVVLRPAPPRSTTHLHRCHAKSPCQLDMTYAMPHTHHCDNPVIINTNLSASAWGAKVLWCWREGGGKRKGRHTKYWSWHCHLLLWDQGASVNVTVHTGQSDKRKANSCSSFCPEYCGFYITQEEVGRSYTHPEKRREGE